MRTSLKPFQEWVDHYPERHRALAAQSPFIGYFCTYTPLELIHAAGFIPVRILGETGPLQNAYSLAPVFICHYMRRAMEKALAGEYTYLTGVVQGYTCDVACGLTNIWQENIPLAFYHTLPLPYNRNPEARTFFRDILRELTQKLNAHGGRFSLESLSRSNELYRKIRRHLLDLYERRYAGRLGLSAQELYCIISAGQVTPPETFLELLEGLRADLQNEIPAGKKGFPVLISGSLLEDRAMPAQLEHLGFRIVADDLCTGLRSFYAGELPGPEGEKDPLDLLIDHVNGHFPCPARSRAKERLPLLKELMARSGARGILFLVQKFCTPHLADYPLLAEALKKEGLPNLLLEIEDGAISGAQQTRLEAFLEIYGPEGC
jgi:benzoyl-CoA reductase/2-hydroxyglutaryl-CoA dehydratase subunit BcrC/BadD/HgdB